MPFVNGGQRRRDARTTVRGGDRVGALPRRCCTQLHFGEWVAQEHRLSDDDGEVLHDAVVRGADDVLELHRLDDDELLTGSDGGSDLDGHGDDRALQRRGDHVPVRLHTGFYPTLVTA